MFLHQPLECLEDMQKDIQVDDSDPEVKKVHSVSVKTEESLLTRLTSRTSSWIRLKRLVCTMLRWKKPTKEIKVDDLMYAQTLLLKMVQQEAFNDEIALLHSGKALGKGSSIYKLNAFLDSNKVLRVGGRLSNSKLEDISTVHPVILPKRSPITTMVVRECHKAVQHSGRGITINEVRTRGFWVINCNSFVRHLISKCVECRRFRGRTYQQRMADLPSDRLEESPPFTVCGVDFFGPFIIKEGRKELKRYGSLFTCFATRAVHIESSNTLETDSFIQALRRFVSRRGNVRTIHSDNGTNFVGAQRELQAAVREMDEQRIKEFLQLRGGDWLSWKRNPPASSHHGGVWERQIRSVRAILTSLLHNHGRSLND